MFSELVHLKFIFFIIIREFPCKEIKEFLSMCELPTVQVPTLLNEVSYNYRRDIHFCRLIISSVFLVRSHKSTISDYCIAEGSHTINGASNFLLPVYVT